MQDYLKIAPYKKENVDIKEKIEKFELDFNEFNVMEVAY